jgi:hypothetical protein
VWALAVAPNAEATCLDLARFQLKLNPASKFVGKSSFDCFNFLKSF